MKDPGQMREELARDLAEWRVAGFRSYEFFLRFFRRVRILVDVTGIHRDEVLRIIQADADAIEQGA